MKLPKLSCLAAAVMLAIGAGLNSGCVATQAESQRTQLINRGYPAAYADGYAAGFQSGQSAAGNPYAALAKDPARYRADDDYKQGWDDGFAAGKGQYDNTVSTTNSLFGY